MSKGNETNSSPGPVAWVHEAMRKITSEAREIQRKRELARRRFNEQDEKEYDNEKKSLSEVLQQLKSSKYTNRKLLEWIKRSLSDGTLTAEDIFRSSDGANHVHGLVNILTGQHNRQDSALQLLSAHVIANLAPLGEKHGQILARSAGPYLVTLLTGSGSVALKEACATAIGNISLSGFKVVKVLLNQEAVESLASMLTIQAEEPVLAASLYALYHIFHSLQAVGKENLITNELYSLVIRNSLQLTANNKPPLEIFWVLFVLSCHPDHHELLSNEDLINFLLNQCTYEIFKKSDSRPLVKVVTPIVRILGNLSAGPMAEKSCLLILRHPDLSAILMSLLGTNYIHLCKETVWLFTNIVNCESVVVQEELVELDLMDKLEYLTVQAVRKLDPYALLNF